MLPPRQNYVPLWAASSWQPRHQGFFLEGVKPWNGVPQKVVLKISRNVMVTQIGEEPSVAAGNWNSVAFRLVPQGKKNLSLFLLSMHNYQWIHLICHKGLEIQRLLIDTILNWKVKSDIWLSKCWKVHANSSTHNPLLDRCFCQVLQCILDVQRWLGLALVHKETPRLGNDPLTYSGAT